MLRAIRERYAKWKYNRAMKRFANLVFRESPVQRALRERGEKDKFKSSFRANSSVE